MYKLLISFHELTCTVFLVVVALANTLYFPASAILSIFYTLLLLLTPPKLLPIIC